MSGKGFEGFGPMERLFACKEINGKQATAPFYLGEMNFPCVLGCGAIHFYKESLATKVLR
jgi:hypothetical protein